MNYWFLYNKSSSIIYEHYLNNVDNWTNIPTGCDILCFDESTASTPVKDAYVNPSHYLVQNGGFIPVANIATLQLQEAQQTKINQLENNYNNTLNAGFVSSASATPLTYGFEDVDQVNLAQQLNMTNAGLATYPIQWATKSGLSIVSLTDVQFKQLCKDANDFKWSQINKLRTKIGQVQTTTTVTAVNSIVW